MTEERTKKRASALEPTLEGTNWWIGELHRNPAIARGLGMTETQLATARAGECEKCDQPTVCVKDDWNKPLRCFECGTPLPTPPPTAQEQLKDFVLRLLALLMLAVLVYAIASPFLGTGKGKRRKTRQNYEDEYWDMHRTTRGR